MIKHFKKALAIGLASTMIIGALAGCGEKEKNDGGKTPTTAPVTQQPAGNTAEPVNTTPFWKSLDKNISGSVDVMCWSGDSIYYEDLGHKDIKAEDIAGQNVASVYALAKEFNKMYPNVKVNLFAQTDDPNSEGTTWRQKLENFKAEHGKYPDVYTPNDLAGDLADGLVADLSVYSDDPMYKKFNTGIMNTMSYYGFQAGLPQFMQPWGVYVNKELAENNNIDVPNYDWTIDEYTDFVTSADNKNFWGTIFGSPVHFIDTGTHTVTQQMAGYTGKGDRVNINSEEVQNLLSYIPKWATSEIWTKNGEGAIDGAIMDDGWWWSYRFFCRNYILTSEGDPWMISQATLPKNEDGTFPANAIESGDWDIYPRPSTDYQGNTVGIVVDPMAVHNYAMDDGNPAWSDAEKTKLDLAYAFASFWCGSTEAMQARADQKYSNNGTLVTCLNDSFPLITGDEFFEQMDIWYSVDVHKRFADAEKMPGFQYVVKLWNEGKIWDISDKTYPYYVTEDGTRKECLYEWLNITNADVVGANLTDANWLDTVKANLPTWNKKINDRFEIAAQSVVDGLKKYYGFTDADFK